MTDEQVTDAYFEERSEYDSIAFRIRCMYEGGGVLCVYAGYDFDAPYFRWREKPIFEKQIKFIDVSDLQNQLEQIQSELVERCA